MFDMFKMMGKLGEVQQKMADVKEKLKTITLEESELDGVVVVEIKADRTITKIRTAPEFYNKYSVEEREEILTEAVNNAIQKADARAKEETQSAMAGVIPNIPGMDLSSLMGGL
jgi:nucleoid-associated protein EbfC